MPDPSGTPSPAPFQPPSPLVVAASLVGIQGLVLVLFAVLEIADLTEGRRSMGAATAVFFGVYGVVLVVGAFALWRGASWSRGPVLLTQLITLGLAWNLRDQPLIAICLALVAVIALAGVVHPDSIAALNGEQPRGNDEPTD